ncbi:hypothetical protein G210_1053, partial [Candida maltosa Xu316]
FFGVYRWADSERIGTAFQS